MGFSRRTFQQKWMFNLFQIPSLEEKKQEELTQEEKNRRHLLNIFSQNALFMALILYFATEGANRLTAKKIVVILHVFANYIFILYAYGDFTTVQMFNSIVLTPAFQFVLGLVTITSERKLSTSLFNEFPAKLCVARSKVEITSFMISMFSAFISSCILFMSIRTSIRKGKLCILGDCTAPEYILRTLVTFVDLEDIQIKQSNRLANDTDDNGDINNNNIQSSIKYEICGFQLPACFNERKFRKATERKRRKEIKQDRLMSEIYFRISKRSSTVAFSSNDIYILKDKYRRFRREYNRGSLYFNKISARCSENLSTSMDCPPLQHEGVLFVTRTILILFYVLFYIFLYSTTQSSDDSGEGVDQVLTLPKSFLRYVFSIMGKDIQILTTALYPILIFYVNILVSFNQSIMYFLLEKIRGGNTHEEFEEMLFIFSKAALLYATLYVVEFGDLLFNSNIFFKVMMILMMSIWISLFLGYAFHVDRLKDRCIREKWWKIRG